MEWKYVGLILQEYMLYLYCNYDKIKNIECKIFVRFDKLTAGS